MGKNVSINLIGKYSHKFLDHAKQYATHFESETENIG